MTNKILKILNTEGFTFLKGIMVFILFLLFINLCMVPDSLYKFYKNIKITYNSSNYTLNKYKIDKITTNTITYEGGSHSDYIVYFDNNKKKITIYIIKNIFNPYERTIRIYNDFKTTISTIRLPYERTDNPKDLYIYVWEYFDSPPLYGIQGEKKIDKSHFIRRTFKNSVEIVIAILTLILFITLNRKQNEIQ